MADECNLCCAHKTPHETNEFEKILLWNWQGKRCDKTCWHSEGGRCINVDAETCKTVNIKWNSLD